MDNQQIQQLMAQYLKLMPQQGQNAQQTNIQQPLNGINMGGFMNPQIPQGGMGSMNGMIQNGVMRK